MKLIPRFASVAVFSVLAVVGCSEKEDLVQRAEHPEIQATWANPCAGSPVGGLSWRTFEKYEGAAYTEVVRYYTDGACTDLAAETRFGGTFTVADKDASGFKPVDRGINTVEMRAISDAGKTALELVGFCGVAAWPVNQAVDLRGKTGGLCPLRAVPSTEFNVFQVENDTLFLGKGGVTTPADRPKELDRGAPLTKSNENI